VPELEAAPEEAEAAIATSPRTPSSHTRRCSRRANPWVNINAKRLEPTEPSRYVQRPTPSLNTTAHQGCRNCAAWLETRTMETPVMEPPVMEPVSAGATTDAPNPRPSRRGNDVEPHPPLVRMSRPRKTPTVSAPHNAAVAAGMGQSCQRPLPLCRTDPADHEVIASCRDHGTLKPILVEEIMRELNARK